MISLDFKSYPQMMGVNMNKLSEYFGEGEFDGRWAYVHALSYNKYAAQAVTDGGHTEFRLGEFPTEEQAEMACEDYVLGVPYE